MGRAQRVEELVVGLLLHTKRFRGRNPDTLERQRKLWLQLPTIVTALRRIRRQAVASGQPSETQMAAVIASTANLLRRMRLNGNGHQNTHFAAFVTKLTVLYSRPDPDVVHAALVGKVMVRVEEVLRERISHLKHKKLQRALLYADLNIPRLVDEVRQRRGIDGIAANITAKVAWAIGMAGMGPDAVDDLHYLQLDLKALLAGV